MSAGCGQLFLVSVDGVGGVLGIQEEGAPSQGQQELPSGSNPVSCPSRPVVQFVRAAFLVGKDRVYPEPGPPWS